MKYMHVMEGYNCSDLPPLIIYNDTHIIVDKTKIELYNSSALSCNYQQFWRIPIKKGEIDPTYEFEKDVHWFNDSARVYEGYFRIKCLENDLVLFSDYYYFFNKTFGRESEKGKFNVIVFALDSVSRHNFHRQMPKTREYLLNDLEAVEYFGYNKVGDNTFPNVFPMLTGRTEKEGDCWKDNYFDECNIVWEDFKRNGFKTVYAEDFTRFRTFGYYGKKGFIKQPTDYYWVTFSKASEDELRHTHDDYYCVGSKQTHTIIIDYSLKVIKHLKGLRDNFFTFFWSSTLTHENINYSKNGDGDHERYLQGLKEMGVLENSILFFLADHGFNRDYRKTSYGKFETNLPILFIVLPEPFKKLYPEATNNLKANSIKLTTHFDTYETLKALSEFTITTDSPKTPSPRGISLFRPIPSDRSCKSAGIDPHYCSCLDVYKEKVDVTDGVVKNITKHTINYMNNQLKKFNCSQLTLHEITQASLANVAYNYYTIDFVTKPGSGSFEVTVSCDTCKDDYQISSTITRTNSYRNQSWCTDDAVVKPFCYCNK